MRIEKNRFCRMLLLLVLLAVLLGSVPVFASDANVQIKVGESAISLTSYTGSTWDNFKNKNVYVANVPAGTTAVDIFRRRKSRQVQPANMKKWAA